MHARMHAHAILLCAECFFMKISCVCCTVDAGGPLVCGDIEVSDYTYLLCDGLVYTYSVEF